MDFKSCEELPTFSFSMKDSESSSFIKNDENWDVACFSSFFCHSLSQIQKFVRCICLRTFGFSKQDLSYNKKLTSYNFSVKSKTGGFTTLFNSLISKSRQINTLLKIQHSKRAMEEQFKHFLVYATRGRGLQIALVTGISIASLGTLCTLNRQKSSRVVTDESQSEIPDADSKTLLEKSLDMKNVTISATKKIFENPEDSKNDWLCFYFPSTSKKSVNKIWIMYL